MQYKIIIGIVGLFLSLSSLAQTITGPTQAGISEEITFTQPVNSCYEPCNYWWEAEEATIISETEESITVKFESPGTFTIKLWLYVSACLCDNIMDESDIIIEDNDYIKYEYDDAGNRFNRMIVSLLTEKKSAKTETDEFEKNKELDQTSFNVYPVPTKQSIYVTVPKNILKATNKHIIIYDINGQIIYHTKTINSIMEINMENHPQGIYILKLAYDGYIKSCKIVKQ